MYVRHGEGGLTGLRAGPVPCGRERTDHILSSIARTMHTGGGAIY